MTDTDECIHGLNQAWCSTCKTANQPAIVTYGGAALARFPAVCPSCTTPIEIGDLIVGRTVTRAGQTVDSGWVHQECTP